MIKNNKMKTAVLVALCSMAIIASGFGMSNVVKYTSWQSVDRAVSETDASVCGVTGSEQDPAAYYHEPYEDNELHILDGDSNMYVYDMSESRNSGVAQAWTTTSGGIFDDVIDFEALYGLRITARNDAVTYCAYSHTSKIAGQITCRLYRVENGNDVFVKNLPSVDTEGDASTLDTKDLKGVYKIKGSFPFDGKTSTCEICFYASDEILTACRIIHNREIPDHIESWAKMLKDADPDDFLSNEKTTYPTSGIAGSCVHVKEWEDISDQIVLKDDWTDEMKVYAMVKYLSENVAYDDYRRNDPQHRTRANMANDYTDDNNFTLKNNVGVCWDYTNILAIMCRHHGIPCTSVDNSYHTYNIVWLNGRWVGIDVSDIAKYTCSEKDTSKENWKPDDTPVYYDSYGIYNKRMNAYDQNIWTKERGSGIAE